MKLESCQAVPRPRAGFDPRAEVLGEHPVAGVPTGTRPEVTKGGPTRSHELGRTETKDGSENLSPL